MRFRNVSIVLFALALCILAVVMTAIFDGVTHEITSEYAESYAVSSAEALSARISKEIALLAKAAGSEAVAEWMTDEHDERKRALAYEEMAEIAGALYSYNLYVGVEKTLNEYRVETSGTRDGMQPIAVLSEESTDDAWYFECVASENPYMLSVDIDHVMQRKRVWLDYKVVRDGVMLGVVCTGLEFSHVVGELFSHNDDMRGLIIDENGMIHMDSSLLGDASFLYDEFETPVGDVFSDPAMLSAIESRPSGLQSPEQGTEGFKSVKLFSASYRFVTIVPIRHTGWAVVVLSGRTSWFDATLLMPVFVTVLVLLSAFTLATGVAIYRLVFQPLDQLEHSLAGMKEHHRGLIYGVGRDDEVGHLAQTVQDLFDQANIDALTGIYNRRYMEIGFELAIKYLSRSSGLLGVLMLDIDYFKKYNDTYGHDQGDACLKAIAQALAGTMQRAGDFVARYGGEEFVVILPNTDETGALVVAEKLLDTVRALGIPHAKNDAAPYVTVSVGVTSGRVAYGKCWEDYVKRADEALYASKQAGRNRCTFLGFDAPSQ